MNVIELESGRVGYRDLLDLVLQHGRREASSPRGLRTLDAGPVTVLLHTPADALPVGTGRQLNPRIAAAEAIQLVGAFSDPRLLPPAFDEYREPEGNFHGAYGLRVRDQLYSVVRRLTSDRDSRRAVVTLWDPLLDDDDDRRDLPCTVALGFRLVGDRLHMRVLMRSQDCWRGTPYDWFQFTQLQLTLARVLSVGTGFYWHTTWSTHLYESDLEAVHGVRAGRPHAPDVDTPEGFGRSNETWAEVELRARRLPYSDRLVQGMTMDELWYRRRLADALDLAHPEEG